MLCLFVTVQQDAAATSVGCHSIHTPADQTCGVQPENICTDIDSVADVQSFWAYGALAEVAVASRILEPYGWRWLLGSAAIPFGGCTAAGFPMCTIATAGLTNTGCRSHDMRLC